MIDYNITCKTELIDFVKNYGLMMGSVQTYKIIKQSLPNAVIIPYFFNDINGLDFAIKQIKSSGIPFDIKNLYG